MNTSDIRQSLYQSIEQNVDVTSSNGIELFQVNINEPFFITLYLEIINETLRDNIVVSFSSGTVNIEGGNTAPYFKLDKVNIGTLTDTGSYRLKYFDQDGYRSYAIFRYSDDTSKETFAGTAIVRKEIKYGTIYKLLSIVKNDEENNYKDIITFNGKYNTMANGSFLVDADDLTYIQELLPKETIGNYIGSSERPFATGYFTNINGETSRIATGFFTTLNVNNTSNTALSITGNTKADKIYISNNKKLSIIGGKAELLTDSSFVISSDGIGFNDGTRSSWIRQNIDVVEFGTNFLTNSGFQFKGYTTDNSVKYTISVPHLESGNETLATQEYVSEAIDAVNGTIGSLSYNNLLNLPSITYNSLSNNLPVNNSETITGTITLNKIAKAGLSLGTTGSGNGISNVTIDSVDKSKINISYTNFLTTHQSIKTLNTNNSVGQLTSNSEELTGSGTINLHKISKTGNYNDLLNKPSISITDDTEGTYITDITTSDHSLTVTRGSHPVGNAHDKMLGFYKFSTDSESHINSVITVEKSDIISLGIPGQDTTYTFASGSNGSFSVTPSSGSAQTVSIGKPATAGTADNASLLNNHPDTDFIFKNGDAMNGTLDFSSGIGTVIDTNNGNIEMGSGTIVFSSDQRLKQNINNTPKLLESILKTNIKTFEFKNNPEKENIGVIAQEIQENFPKEISNILVNSDDEYLSVNETKFVYTLWSAFNEYVEKTTNELNILKEEIKYLKSKIKED